LIGVALSTNRPHQEERKKVALPRELTEFLVAFSIAAHRCAMYPPDHPILPVNICDKAVIGAGAVVTRDIMEPGVYAGNPAKKIN
jgi:hypothetical protein